MRKAKILFRDTLDSLLDEDPGSSEGAAAAAAATASSSGGSAGSYSQVCHYSFALFRLGILMIMHRYVKNVGG